MTAFLKRAAGPALMALALGGAAAPAPASAPRPVPAAAMNMVSIKNMGFSSGALKVKVGSTVTWTNGDQVPHNVVARDGSFRSKFLTKGQSFSFTFSKKGEFAYSCAIHPQMVGKIRVT
jgi:plastocyanin